MIDKNFFMFHFQNIFEWLLKSSLVKYVHELTCKHELYKFIHYNQNAKTLHTTVIKFLFEFFFKIFSCGEYYIPISHYAQDSSPV